MSVRRSVLAVAACGILALLIGFDEPATRPFVVGHLGEPKLRESSGVVESRRYPGIYWTHNDSGNDPILYAILRDGRLVNSYRVKGIAVDWEDIAIDDHGQLYLGDIGNNGNVRAALGVTMVDEPNPNGADDRWAVLEPKKQWLLTLPDNGRMDCESLFVWKGDGYLVKKSVDRSPTTLWRFSLTGEGQQELQPAATLPVDAMCTGADLSADGDSLAVMSIDGPLLFRGLAGDLKNVEKIRPASIRIDRRVNEAVCFTEGGLLGTSEQRDVYFFPFETFESTTQPAN